MAPPGEADIAVLIVDDHALVAEALTAALDDEPGVVVCGTARSVAECMATLGSRRVDVVLMESVLPDGGGAQQTPRILQDHPGVRVVLLTTRNDRAGRAAALRAGCAGYANREGSMAELLSIIREAHRGDSGGARSGRSLARDASAPHAEVLTIRELEVLQLLGHGRSTADICSALAISAHTLRNHVSNVLGKLRAHSKLEAVSLALSSGLIARPGEETPRS